MLIALNEQNGIVKLVNQTIVQVACNMLQHSGLSPKFWVEAMNVMVQLKVRSCHKVVIGMTPKHAWGKQGFL